MPIAMNRLQVADRVLGPIACTLLQPLRWIRSLVPRHPRTDRVLLIKFWGLGSLELLTPAARALRTRFPEAHIALLTLSQNRAFAEGLGVFDEVHELDVATSSWWSVWRRILGLIARLRRERFDHVFDFEFFTRFSAVISLLSGAPDTHGFSSSQVWRGRFHTQLVHFNRYWHVARNFRALAGGETGEEVEPSELTAFNVQPEHQEEVEQALKPFVGGDDGPLVVLNPNAGTLSLERRWPRGSFAELARRLIRYDRAHVVLVGAKAEREWTSAVELGAGSLPEGRILNLAGELSIGGLSALLTRADAFVSNDSGPMHLAAALGAPTLGLFGPETPVMYSPLGARARWIYKPPSCSPCINVHDNKFAVCHRGRPDCLIQISVDEVYSETRSLLHNEPHLVLAPRLPFAGGPAETREVPL